MKHLSEFANVCGLKIVRDGSFSTMGFIDVPQTGMVTFLDQERLLNRVNELHGIGGVIATPRLAKHLKGNHALAETGDPRQAFFELHNCLALETDFYWSSFPTKIDPSAKVDEKASISPTDVIIGPRCRIEANAILLPRVELGEDAVIYPGAVLGTEGLQRTVIGQTVTDLAHAGSVRIGNNVKVLCNAVVAAGVFRQSTVIGEGTRVGNQAFISHNVTVQERCVIGHGAVIAGNCVLERDVTIGPRGTVTNGIKIGERAHVTAGGTVVQDVEPGHRVSGGFALDHRRYLRFLSNIR